MAGYSLAEKIFRSHLAVGDLDADVEVAIRPDQLLLQDATAVTACLQFQAMGLDKVQVNPTICYVDHNLLQVGFENGDDHRYLQDFCERYGALFSRQGNGICHQVQMERFARPGTVLLGSDSHTPTAGAVGALGIGMGGLDLAAAMAGAPYFVPRPTVLAVKLTGRLRPWVSAKDVALEVLRRVTVRGGPGKILEYTGPGVATLSVPERATIANLGAETGATSSIFPSDRQTLRYLRWQQRDQHWQPLAADRNARYDELIEIDLGDLEPLVALPFSPDNVVPVKEVEGLKVDQVCVGSCTNSSYRDLSTVAAVLKGRTVASGLNLVVSPGSRQVLSMITQRDILSQMIDAGARLLEAACGPCNGIGQAPPSEGVSVRTHNRNYKGRSGTLTAKVYLASPETAAATAIAGVLTNPRRLGTPPRIRIPARAAVDDSLVLHPSGKPGKVQPQMGPNIVPIPSFDALPKRVSGEVLLKVGDDITTDHIVPGGAALLALRSNVPANADYAFQRVDPTFPARARQTGGGLIVAGNNYGQGSSREHAALVVRYLGVSVVVARSFARIHRTNLLNFGVLPAVFAEPTGYDLVGQGERWVIDRIEDLVRMGAGFMSIESDGASIPIRCSLTEREKEILLAGGLLNYARSLSRES